MADVALPSLTELAQAEFMSPMMFQQAQNQIGLGTNFANQNLAQGAEALKAAGLKNMFDEQANPMKVQQLGLQNEGMGYENTVKGVQARQSKDLEGEDKAAKRAKLLASASEDDLKRLQATAQAEMMDPDPTVAERGKRKMDASYEEISKRRKAADELAKTQAIVGGRQSVAEANAGARSASDQLKADTAIQIAQMKSKDNQAKLASVANKPAKNLEEELTRAYANLASESDPDKRSDLLEYVNGVNGLLIAAKQAATAPNIDTATVANLPKRGTPPAAMPPVLNAPPGRAPMGNMATEGAAAAAMRPDAAEQRRAAVDLSAVEEEYARTKDPAARKVLEEQIKKERAYKQQVSTPQAPAGRVVIYKDGKAVGSVPQAQADAAVKQGYSLK